MKVIWAIVIFCMSLPAAGGEAAFFSPDCRDCEAAVNSGGARVGNAIGVQNSPAGPPASLPPPAPAPARQ